MTDEPAENDDPQDGGGEDDDDEPRASVVRVPDAADGTRIDRFLADHGTDLSRSAAGRMVKEGGVTLDGRPVKKASETVKAGQQVHFVPPPPAPPELVPEDIPLEILWEDGDLIAVNKPPGMVTHPATLHMSGTLANALAYHFAGSLSDLHGDPTRVGIVHRLDRDTSGVILAARDEWVHYRIGRQFEQRTISKRYLAIAHGWMEHDEDVVDEPIGRHPKHREMQTIRVDGRPATTMFRALERFDTPAGRFTYIECRPRTGRTHQIRVHLKYRRLPIVADSLYAGGRPVPSLASLGLGEADEPLIGRHALHASAITFHHPRRDEELTVEAPLPDDMQRLLDALQQASSDIRRE